MNETVGFIGLGNMGLPMAKNLLKRGFSLIVHDVDMSRAHGLTALGAQAVDSPAKVAEYARRTVLMVATTEQSEAVLFGNDSVSATARADDIILCMGTIDPLAVRRCHARFREKDVHMIDAPVSGGTDGAASGALSIMIGGTRAVADRCQDIFEALGSKTFYVGDSGQGMAMKLVNNMLIQINIVAISEAFVLGTKAGIAPRTIYDVVRASSGNSMTFETRAPRILNRNFVSGGTVEISRKDQELQTAFARQLGCPLTMAGASLQVYRTAVAAGLKDKDAIAVVEVLERMAGIDAAPCRQEP